jgi:hypothetical protein
VLAHSTFSPSVAVAVAETTWEVAVAVALQPKLPQVARL